MALLVENASTNTTTTLIVDGPIGQTVTMTATTASVTAVAFLLQRNGSPTGSITVDIYALDGADKPTGAALASKALVASSLSTSLTWVTFTLDSALSVSALTKYGFVMDCPGASGENSISIRLRDSDVYAGGEEVSSSDGGATWVISDSVDLGFKLYGEEAAGISAAQRCIVVN